MGNNTVLQFDSPGRRAAAYWFADGLEEIYFGLFLFVPSALALGVRQSLHTDSLWIHISCGVIAAFAGNFLFFKDRPILDFIKSRLTYSRTGYARPPENPAPGQDVLIDLLTPDQRWSDLVTLHTIRDNRENVTSFKARTVFPFMMASMVAAALREPWSVALLMVIVAALVYALNRREAHSYSKGAMLPIALAGLLSAAVEIPSGGRIFIPLVIGGGWLSARGGWALIRYLRIHPRTQAPEGDR
jgi:hypothetical protein